MQAIGAYYWYVPRVMLGLQGYCKVLILFVKVNMSFPVSLLGKLERSKMTCDEPLLLRASYRRQSFSRIDRSKDLQRAVQYRGCV